MTNKINITYICSRTIENSFEYHLIVEIFKLFEKRHKKEGKFFKFLKFYFKKLKFSNCQELAYRARKFFK